MDDIELTLEEQIEMDLSNKFYHDYFHSFTSQLDQLDFVKDFKRDDRIVDQDDDKHIQYKYKVGKKGETFLYSWDGHRTYEFLIEFDKVNTAYGIYYGCRAHVCKGNLKDEIHILDKEWSTLKGEVCKVLNNTFVDKDFSKRCRPTNNAWDSMYWPFWISLEHDEDIVGVAARATRLIANVYRKYLSKTPKCYVCVPLKSKKISSLNTAFTKDEYRHVLDKINETYGKEACNCFQDFIKKGLSNKYKLFSLDKDYEYALRFEKKWTNLEIAALIGRFCVDNDITNPRTLSIPWELFDKIFLSSKGKPFSIKTSYDNAKGNEELNDKAINILEQMGFR